MSHPLRSSAIFAAAARTGLAARAVVYWLRDQPFGVWLYALGAIFIGGYGVYSATQARCLKFD